MDLPHQIGHVSTTIPYGIASIEIAIWSWENDESFSVFFRKNDDGVSLMC